MDSRHPEREQVVEIAIDSRFELLDLVHEVAEEILSQAGFDEEQRYWLTVAIREAVNNAIEHGNRLDQRKRVRIRFVVEPQRVTVRVRDQGQGFELGRVPSPVQSENLLKGGGRGVYFMRKFMDRVEYQRCGRGGSEVCLIKHRTQQPSPMHKEDR